MEIWYDKFPEYYERFKKTSKDIEKGIYNLNLPGLFPKKYIRYSKDENSYVYSGSETLKHFLFKLQYFAHLNTSSTDIKKSRTIECKIFSQPITFRLSESKIKSKYSETGRKMVRGKQILFAVVGKNGKRKMTAYSDIMPELEAYPSKDLAKAMLNALNTSQFCQNFEGLEEWIIPAASLFILLTHIIEGATPFPETMKEFDRAIRYNRINTKNKIKDIKKKTGRIPMADKIVRSKLRDVAEGKVLFKDAFSEKNFVIRGKDGTSKGRTWVLEDQAGVLTGNLSDSEDNLSDSEDNLSDSEDNLSDSEDEISTLLVLPIERKFSEKRKEQLNKVLIPES